MKINVNNLLNIVTASVASMSEMNVEWFGHWKGKIQVVHIYIHVTITRCKQSFKKRQV